jgi:uncharacterized damage-inducible protein DinB
MTTLPQQDRTIHPSANYEPEITRWVWAIEDTRQRTKQGLANLSPAALDWVPPDGGNTIGTLLYHIPAIELSYLYEDILELGWVAELAPLLPYPIRSDDGRLTHVVGESLDAHLERLDRSRALLLQHLSHMTLDEWRRPRRIENYTITPEWAIHHLMQHEAEHRGELMELRRRAQG